MSLSLTGLEEGSVHADFEALYLECKGLLFGYALRLCRHRENAEDVLQEAVLRAYKKFSRPDGYLEQGNFVSWMVTIIRNTFITRYRQGCRFDKFVARPDLDDIVLAGFQGSWGSQSVEEEVAGMECLDELMALVRQTLSERFAQVLILVDLHDFSYEEAALEMKCPIGTVMSSLSRARKQMRRALSRYPELVEFKVA